VSYNVKFHLLLVYIYPFKNHSNTDFITISIQIMCIPTFVIIFSGIFHSILEMFHGSNCFYVLMPAVMSRIKLRSLSISVRNECIVSKNEQIMLMKEHIALE